MGRKIFQNPKKISLILLLLTIPLILFMELEKDPEEITINSITLFDLNKPVTIYAQPENQNIYNNHLILTLKQNNSTINAIFFNQNKTLKNQKHKFYAKISQYRGEIQLEIQKAKLH